MTHTKFTAYKELDHTGHRCTIDWQGRHLEFANTYLPSKPIPRLQKIPELKNILTKTTFAAGDWNCVPDVSKDIQSDSRSPSLNVGGAQLNDIMAELGLVDYRRTQLGSDFEFSNLHDS